MKIAIVGGGPAGLVAALAAKRLGLDATVFEQAPDFLRVGGGILIHSNGLRVLEALEILDSFEPKIRAVRKLFSVVPPDRIVGAVDYAALDVPQNRCGVVLRYVLQEHLLEAAMHAGAEVRFAHRLKTLERRGATVSLEFESGATFEADAVIACDGINSATREAARVSARKVGIGEAYLRAVAERGVDADNIRELWGTDGRRFGICPLPGDRTYIFCSVPLGEWDAIRAGRLDAWIDSWSGYGAETLSLLRAVPDWNRVSYDELSEVHLARWSSPPVFIAGDAAHAMTPNLGQGANSAMVDALVLTRILAETIARGGGLETAAGEYEAVRRNFVTRIQTAARQMGAIAGLRHPLARASRDAILAAMQHVTPVMRRAAMLGVGYNPAEEKYLSVI